jgi:hypothetical protein
VRYFRTTDCRNFWPKVPAGNISHGQLFPMGTLVRELVIPGLPNHFGRCSVEIVSRLGNGWQRYAHVEQLRPVSALELLATAGE